MPILVDPTTGRLYRNVPDAELQRARGEFGLVTEDEWAERQKIAAADTKGPLGLIGEGFQRGLGHIADIARGAGWTPPVPGSDAFGIGGGMPPALGEAAPHTPIPPPGAEIFPEANSPEARIRTEQHPVYTGIGTGLAVAPFAGVAAAAGGALAPAGILGGTVGGLLGEAAVEGPFQEWDDAWLEQRPYDLKRAAGYTAAFAVGDLLLRGSGRVIGSAVDALKGASANKGLMQARNIVAEAQGKAAQASGKRATQSVGAASAQDLAEPFDDAIATMTERDATTLARDADDHYQIISRHAADDITRIHRGLGESLGTNLKHEDFRIGADAWDNTTLERQSEWLEEMEGVGRNIVEELRAPPQGMNYGNAGAQIANDLESYWTQIMNEADGAQRNILVDALKKKLDKRMMALDADFRGDAVARGAIKDIIRDYAGAEGLLRRGLENPEYWGHNADLQKALNSPWHRMLKGWQKFNEKFLEATGETMFDNMGADRKVMQSTAEKVMSVLQKDPRLLHEFGQQVGEVFDGYTDLVLARETHGITHKEGLEALRNAVVNLQEDWNLAATIGVAKNKASHALRNPRNWGRMALDVAEKTPGVGGYLQAARNVGRNFGDLHVTAGTPLSDVWDRGLRRYARHPSLPDPSVYQNYSPWMQEALRARGAAIPGGPPGAAAADVGSKVAGMSLFGLGGAAQAHQSSQPQQVDEQGNPVPAQAGAGPLGLMGLGLAMLFKRRGAIRVLGERARRELGRLEPATVRAIDDAIEVHVAQLGADLMRGSQRDVAQLMQRVKLAVGDEVNREMQAAGGGSVSRKITDLRVEQTFAEAAQGLPEEVRAAAQQSRGRLATTQALEEERLGRGYDDHPLEQVFGEAHHERTVLGMHDLKSKRKVRAEVLEEIRENAYRFHDESLVNMHMDGSDVDAITKRFDEAVEYQKKFIEYGLKHRAAKQELAGLTPEEDEYLRLFMENEVQNAWTREKRTPPAPMAGIGARARHALRYLLKEPETAERMISSVRDMPKALETNRLSLSEQLATSLRADGSFPSRAVRPVAEDIVQALVDGASLREAVDEVARALNQGAERIPLNPTMQQSNAWAVKEWLPRASADLGFSVQRAVDEYAGDFDYRNINAFAREGSGATFTAPKHSQVSPDAQLARHKAQAEDLQLALDYAIDNGYTSPGTTWRGVLLKPKELEKLQEVASQGGVAEAHAFMSTTADEDYALRFIERKNQLKRDRRLRKVILEVVQKTGVPMNPNEAEVLMRAGSRFQLEPLPVKGREHARFRATELDTEPRLPSQLKHGAGGAKALPWIAGGVLALGNLTRTDKAAAAGPPPELPEVAEPPPDQGPLGVYRDAMKGIAEGGDALVRQTASAALRQTPPKGRPPLRSFTGRRDLDDAVDDAREALGHLQTDPSAFVERLAGSVGELGKTHPSVYMAITEKAAGIVSYLSAEAPPRTGQTLLDPKGSPPSRDRSVEFAYKVVGATMPTRAMSDIARLDVPPEELAAFKQWWPELWEPLRLELLGQTIRRAEAGRPPDAEKLRQLDSLLEMNGQLDPSASMDVAQHVIAAANAAPAAPASQGSPDQAPSGQSKLFMTRQQASRTEAAING